MTLADPAVLDEPANQVVARRWRFRPNDADKNARCCVDDETGRVAFSLCAEDSDSVDPVIVSGGCRLFRIGDDLPNERRRTAQS
jgi:hypothetical protein